MGNNKHRADRFSPEDAREALFGLAAIALAVAVFVVGTWLFIVFANKANAAESVNRVGSHSLHIVEPADHHVTHVRVTYAERVGPRLHRLYFEYNDGAAGYAGPCLAEDSTYCWWDAQRRGNHRGTSVINLGEGHHLLVLVPVR